MSEWRETLFLPRPPDTAGADLLQAVHRRRSVRRYGPEPLSLGEVSQLLWAGQGITSAEGYRTAPSAGALFPLQLYLAAGRVQGLAAGIYHYLPAVHQLGVVAPGDRRAELAALAVEQTWIGQCAAVLVFGAAIARTTGKYGARGLRYVYLEVGHAAQNVFLQATALGLGAAVVGAFDDEAVKNLLGMPTEEQALYLMPLGRTQA